MGRVVVVVVVVGVRVCVDGGLTDRQTDRHQEITTNLGDSFIKNSLAPPLCPPPTP